MLYLKRNGLSHRDWFVQIVPCPDGFGFCCHHSMLGIHTNGFVYPTSEAALIAGCNFIDREQALAALSQVLNEWISAEKISLEEYWELSNFCPNPE